MVSFTVILLLTPFLYFGGFLAYHVVRQVSFCLNPESCGDVHEFARAPDGVMKTCNATQFQHVRTETGITDFARVLEIMDHYNKPVLFKNFMPTENMVSAMLKHDKTLEFSDIKIKAFGNTFYKGLYSRGARYAKLSEVLDNITAEGSEGSEGSESELFASFVPFLDEAAMADILPGIPLGRFQADSNFISNFGQDVLSTAMHSASCVSYSFQAIGTKLWIFASPEDMEKMDAVSIPTNVPKGFSEAKYFAMQNNIPYVLVEDGDLMVFPPFWGHAVVSKVPFYYL